MNKIFYSLLILCLSVTLFACSGEKKSAEPKTTLQPSVHKKVEKVQPILVQEEPKKPEYQVAGVKDPFQPFEGNTPGEGGITGDLSKVDPLQYLSLSQVYLVGIITGKKNKALIQDTSGMGYIISEGMLIGENNGIITKITKDNITIKQHFKDYMGRVNTREVLLSLKKEEGVK
jgi:type IV pilus assembly protein PilP